MGRMRAEGMADAVRDGDVSLVAALEYHLTVNHYPPVPRAMVAVCVAAIGKAQVGEWKAMVDLPEGVVSREGLVAVPADTVIESFHLEPFLYGCDVEN